jgi:hypothetical protein
LLKNGIQVHIFGVARLSLVSDFMQLGVTSADSAAPLRRAFLGENNYWVLNGRPFEAIRVPEVALKRNKRGVYSVEKVLQGNNQLSFESLAKLEQGALASLRAYDKGEASLQETLKAVLEYDRLYGDERDHSAAYERTLADKPWQQCNCSICKAIGVEVIIFRGNNRNRRRGFHNVKTFYGLLQCEREHPKQFNQTAEESSDISPQQLLLDEVWL